MSVETLPRHRSIAWANPTPKCRAFKATILQSRLRPECWDGVGKH